ncbi:MAG: hypothetical protein HRU02_17925 [Myxococcales bacterium]|nr:hypothetical protein [Myxococcales bacterium]
MTRVTLVATCLTVALVVACRTAPILNPDGPLGPPASASLDDIAQAVVKAGTRLGWVIELEGPGEARGTLQLRNHEAVVKILFSKQNLQIDYVSSKKLYHSGNEIHRKYNNWVKKLRARIQRKVAEIQ